MQTPHARIKNVNQGSKLREFFYSSFAFPLFRWLILSVAIVLPFGMALAVADAPGLGLRIDGGRTYDQQFVLTAALTQRDGNNEKWKLDPYAVMAESYFSREFHMRTGPDAADTNVIRYTSEASWDEGHLNHNLKTHQFLLVTKSGAVYTFNDFSAKYGLCAGLQIKETFNPPAR